MKRTNLVAVDQAVGMTDRDCDAMRAAVRALEHRGSAARLASLLGKPIELLGGMLPPGAATLISSASVRALEAALKLALATLPVGPQVGSVRLNRMLALASRAVGGSLGLVSLPVELPISTIIMPRSIADVARTHRARTLIIPRLRATACRYSGWRAAVHRMMSRKAAISPSAPCRPNRSMKRRAPSPNAASPNRARPCWFVSSARSRRASAW